MSGVAVVPAALDRFPQVWAADFEFVAPDGERPDPVCAVFRELRTGQEVRCWGNDLHEPVVIPDDAVLVAFYASAEIGCFLALDWPLPLHLLDLFAEYRTLTNGALGTSGQSLLDALKAFGLTHMDPDAKQSWRDRIIRGWPFTDAERNGILDYCASDVYALAHLLPLLVACLERRPLWLDHALLRGRYMKAAARIERTGTPIDVPQFSRLAGNWDWLKIKLIERIEDEFPIFDGSTLKLELFERWLVEHRIPWPRTETGRLSMSEQTFKTMAKAYPIISPIYELRENLNQLRIAKLAVGSDGRNRCLLSPFRARTARNAPSGSAFIFGPSVWLRSLIQPAPGRALAYIDFRAQEVGIAAALSGDPAMQRAYVSGDPYVGFAVESGLAPAGATKASHGMIRERCKVLVLGTLYGMREETLARNLGIAVCEARRLLRTHRQVYRVFWSWVERVTDTALLRGWIDTAFGWRLHVTFNTRATSLLNHPMQSTGAEILRLACCLLTEASIEVCAPVHDAVLIEAPEGRIEHDVAVARALLGKASRIVLGGFEIGTDAKIIRYPEQYHDARGGEMWRLIQGLLNAGPETEIAPDFDPEITDRAGVEGDAYNANRAEMSH